MKSNELGKNAGHGKYRRIEVSRLVNAPIEKVWSAITDRDELCKWVGPCEIDAREGGRMKTHDSDCGGDGHDQNGTIKVFQPPHVLEYTWNDKYVEDGLVRYDLVQLADNKTQITLVNTLISLDFISAAAGWHEMIERLCDSIDTGEVVPDDESRHQELYSLYETALR